MITWLLLCGTLFVSGVFAATVFRDDNAPEGSYDAEWLRNVRDEAELADNQWIAHQPEGACPLPNDPKWITVQYQEDTK